MLCLIQLILRNFLRAKTYLVEIFEYILCIIKPYLILIWFRWIFHPAFVVRQGTPLCQVVNHLEFFYLLLGGTIQHQCSFEIIIFIFFDKGIQKKNYLIYLIIQIRLRYRLSDKIILHPRKAGTFTFWADTKQVFVRKKKSDLSFDLTVKGYL